MSVLIFIYPTAWLKIRIRLASVTRTGRDIYTDATLRSLIERALDHNKDMLIAAARVKEMAAQKRISTAALLPDIKGKVTGERELENHGGDAFKRSDTFEAQFLVSWEVDLWGNLRWARSASIAEYLQSIEAQRALQMTIVAEVAQAYYELVALDTELDIVKQTLKAREEGVRLARIRFAGGLTSETSYRQAQVELARTATLVPDLERKISLKENDIAYLAGEYPNKIARSRLLQEFNLSGNTSCRVAVYFVGTPSRHSSGRAEIDCCQRKSRSGLYEYVPASCSDWWFWYGEYFIVRIVEISVCSNGRGFVDSYLWLGKEPCGIESEKRLLMRLKYIVMRNPY